MSAAQPQARAPAQRKLAKKGLFAKDCRSPHSSSVRPARTLTTARAPAVAPMMYGFGDDNPAPDSIAVMEELVIEHITDIVRRLPRFPHLTSLC